MVTAELAVALPALVLVILTAVTGVAVVAAQLRCADAAAGAARLAARGSPLSSVQPLVRADAPGATVQITEAEQTVTATVRTTVRPLRFLPGISVAAHVTDPLEPVPVGP
jgi:hypothetical protein